MVSRNSTSVCGMQKPLDDRPPGEEDLGDDALVVYIVDDDPAVLKALTRLVETAGHAARPFASARDFFAAHDPDMPGCAIIDLLMPDYDGLEVQRFLQAAGRPVIFLTGAEGVEQIIAATKSGAVDLLTKPIDGERLLHAIERAVGHDRKMRPARRPAAKN